jgi:hypothetical protein
MLLAVSDAVWMGVITMIGTSVIPIVAAWIIRSAARTDAKAAEVKADKVAAAAAIVATKAAEVAAKVEEVKATAAESKRTTDEKLDEIHKLVNSNMVALRKIANVALKRVAELTDDPDDIAASLMAEKLLAEQEIPQPGTSPSGEKP